MGGDTSRSDSPPRCGEGLGVGVGVDLAPLQQFYACRGREGDHPRQDGK